jgi:hypothetical protein
MIAAGRSTPGRYGKDSVLAKRTASHCYYEY